MTMWGTQPRSTWNWKAEPRLRGARAKVESSRRWEGSGGEARVKRPSLGMFIEKTVLGRTQPSHFRDLGTGRLRSRALPDEFSHFHFIKFLVQK